MIEVTSKADYDLICAEMMKKLTLRNGWKSRRIKIIAWLGYFERIDIDRGYEYLASICGGMTKESIKDYYLILNDLINRRSYHDEDVDDFINCIEHSYYISLRESFIRAERWLLNTEKHPITSYKI